MARRVARGFTLIEIAVVLGIIGIILSIGVAALSALGVNQAASETRKKQDAIREALIAYLGRNGRLPCPDTNTPPDGRGDDNRLTAGDVATACGPAGGPAPKVAAGLVPWLELGLPRESVLDGWSNYFTYLVSNGNDPGEPRMVWTRTLVPTSTGSYWVSNRGNIPVLERTFPGGTATDVVATNEAVVALLSHGINGAGAVNPQGLVNAAPAGADELQNLNGDGAGNRVLIKRPVAESGTFGANGVYDDILAFYSAADLTGSFVKTGNARWTNAWLAQIQTDTKAYVTSHAIATGLIPPATTPAPGVPVGMPASAAIAFNLPWGGVVEYQQLLATPVCSAAATANAYSMIFTPDDGSPQQTINVPLFEIQAKVGKCP